MTDPMLYAEWQTALIIAGVIIVAAAALLIMVWHSARRILKLAKTALNLVVEIKNNTRSIWELQQTNSVASDILEEAESIERNAGKVARALHESEEAA
jgi:hypothetical protein